MLGVTCGSDCEATENLVASARGMNDGFLMMDVGYRGNASGLADGGAA